MAKLTYKVELYDLPAVEGTVEISTNANIIVENLPEGTIKSVKANMHVPVSEHERIFMNGYQTWTYCPEYDLKSRLRGLHGIPKKLVKHYGFDRYGDYNFVKYPNKTGITHGHSWCYFRDGSNYRLFASLDEHPGYTLFSYNANTETLTIERDCSGIKCGGEYHLFDLFVCAGEEDIVFDRWFRFLNIKPHTDEYITGYSSWYNRYENIDESSIYADLEGCCEVLKSNDLFQVDDGWEPHVGDWLESDLKKFPKGMKDLADKIHEKGFRAGIWLAPFVCNIDSSIYKNHPDWLLKKDGQPWYCGCNWGGFYSLDIDHPEVISYIEQTFSKVLDTWGYDLVKLDFLYAAAPFGSDTETRAARMIRALELLRKVCGSKLILGCGVPLMPAFGIVDYCRIGCDVSLDWNDKFYMRAMHRERVSTKHSIGNTIFRRQLNNRAFINDPDVFFLREKNIKLSAQQKHILGTVNAVFGGVLLCSDNMSEYSDDALERYERLLRSRHASNVVVENDNELKIKYSVNGVERKVLID